MELVQKVIVPPMESTKIRTIKIKSPQSDIKLHKQILRENSIISSELLVRGSSVNQSSSDDVDKMSQAWNRLKINALSKAIAMAPYVGSCSLGPRAPSVTEVERSESDVEENDRHGLRNVVTSTPVNNTKQPFKKLPKACSATISVPDKTETCSLDISEIPVAGSKGNLYSQTKEISELEKLRLKCLHKIEEQTRKCAERKKEELLRLMAVHDGKIKEKLAALKIELEQENLLRLQDQYMQTQKNIMETKESAQLKDKQLEQSKVDHSKRIAETAEKIRLIEQKRKELEEREKQKREELKKIIDGIYEMQVSYGKKYTQIAEITKKCRDIRSLNEKVSAELPKLRGMNELLLKLSEKSKDGKATLKDLKIAETLVQQVTVICEHFSKHTDDINKTFDKAEEESKKEQAEKELIAQQEETERQQKTKEKIEKVENEKMRKLAQSAKLLSGIEDCVSGESLKLHLELSRFLETYEKSLEPLLTNDSLKQFRFECQKVVNVPVNAISPLDDLHLEDKFYKLSRLLSGQAVPCGNTMFLATGHSLGVPFCTNLLAKKFVKQGELAVSSKPEAAFAIAAVIVSLWVDFPDFGRLLLAHFHRECPYLIPAFLPQVEGQTNEDYYRMLGYQYSEDGKVESQDKFLRRMSGVMRLYAAILVTPLKHSQVAAGKQHPHNMQQAWRWLTATLNLRPRPDISPTLIFDFLEVTGHRFYQTYGSQFTKLLHVLCADYFPLIEQITPDGCGGPVVRLKTFLEKILKEGQVPHPTGLLPPKFW